jgi:hypothetical protein
MNLAHENSTGSRQPRGLLDMPPFCKDLGPDRTKVFHVKHLGPIDGLRKHTFVKRGTVRNRSFAQADKRVRV